MNPLRFVSCAFGLLALALCVPGTTVDADGALRTGTPFTGALPAPKGTPRDSDAELGSHVVRILDGRTGEPIQGAFIRRYPEMIQDYWIRHDFLLAQGQADERGYARISAEGYNGDCHWVADAKGFGPHHDYGVSAPEVVYLFPGVDVGGRLLDSVGQPVAGGRVDYFLGCGHGPTMRAARTDEQGRFTLHNVNPYDGQLWIEGAGIQADYHDVESLYQFGSRLHDIIAEPGMTAIGRVVDAAGVPIQGVVVRSVQCHRGPATMTDAEGNFVLRSVEPRNELYFHHPASLRKSGTGTPHSAQHDRIWHDDVPRTYRLDHLRLLPPPVATGRLVVNSHAASATDEEEAVGFEAVSLSNGGVVEAYEEHSLLSVALPPDRWRITPGIDARLARFTFDPFEVDVAAGQTTQARITYREQPRLVITGFPERWDLLVLGVPGVRRIHANDDERAWSPYVPADGPVALCVRANENAPTRCFRAGPLEAGNVRRLTIELPKPTRIELAGPKSGYDDVTLYLPGHPVAQDLHPDQIAVRDGDARVFNTYASGKLELHVQTGHRLHKLVLDVPQEGGSVLRVDPTHAPSESVFDGAANHPPELVAVLDVQDASGSFASDAEFVLGEQWNHDVERKSQELTPALQMLVGQWGRVVRPGWRTLHVRPTKPGPLPLRWGSAMLDLHIEYDGEDIDTPTTVWVDDTAYTAPAGRLVLRGLEPGSHDVIVVPYEPGATPRDDDSPPEVTGRRLQVTLTADATRIVRVGVWQDD